MLSARPNWLGVNGNKADGEEKIISEERKKFSWRGGMDLWIDAFAPDQLQVCLCDFSDK